jgi:hypothetical protein
MYKFFYTQYQANKEVDVSNLKDAKNLMYDHHLYGRSCAQAIVDFEDKKIYVLSEHGYKSYLREREDDGLGFEPKNFELIKVGYNV